MVKNDRRIHPRKFPVFYAPLIPYLFKKFHPPCASPAPVGGGSAYDAPGLSVQKISTGMHR